MGQIVEIFSGSVGLVGYTGVTWRIIGQRGELSNTVKQLISPKQIELKKALEKKGKNKIWVQKCVDTKIVGREN